MKIAKIVCLAFFLFSSTAFCGDDELYQLINGSSYTLQNDMLFTLTFSGNSDLLYTGVAILTWSDSVVVNSTRYPIVRREIFQFFVWNGVIGIDVETDTGYEQYNFTIDYAGCLVEVGDLKFQPKVY